MLVVLGDVFEENVFHEYKRNQNQHPYNSQRQDKMAHYIRYLGMCHAVRIHNC